MLERANQLHLARTPLIRLWLACLVGAAAAAPVPVWPAERRTPSEYEVKAAFLFHFAQLVKWPQEPSEQPLVVGVAGQDPFGPLLEKTIGAQSVRGRPIRIVRARSVAELQPPPDILFVGAADLGEARRMLTEASGAPLLTVGELAGFAGRGGIVEFRITADNRVSFDINRHAAELAGLRISSQLLKIARIVESRP